ncbi:hypothetical protein Tco_1569856 [Tanacetum coccineum]
MPNPKSFAIQEGHLTTEDILAQAREMKRLADLKDVKEKSEESLKKMFNSATVKAQTQKWVEHEEKRRHLIRRYTMRITRDKDPLNVTVYKKFRLKTLGFSEWLEAKKPGVPPPHELANFEISSEDKKRKMTEILKEVFVKDDIVVDGMHRNVIPPTGVEGRRGLVIRELKAVIFYYNGNYDLVFQRQLEFHLATTIQLVMKGLSECKDIVKEVEDYLKTYSSAGMDNRWYVEGIRRGYKESQRWQYSDYPVTL